MDKNLTRVKEFIKQGKLLAFIYNVRHKYPDANDPRTFLDADYDDPETISYITNHLKKCGFNLLPLEADENIETRLKNEKANIDLVLNYSEVIIKGDRKSQITSVCEKLSIPFTGSSNKIQVLIRNKGEAKKVMRKAGISVLDDQIFTSPSEPLKENLKFPLIVKPIGQGSSAGITNKSVVNNLKELKQQLKETVESFNDAALVEPFITGREFSIPLIGNPPEVLPIIEPDFATLPKNYVPIDSLEIKWLYEEEVSDHLFCPAKIDKNLKRKIESTVKKVWDALNIKDLCRIDTRCDKDGNLFVLEVNSPPGLLPPEISTTSYLPLSARTKGLSYQDLLKTIVDTALTRYQ